ncbi:MAG: hypothetical protein ORN27_10955 [Rhodoluna sp.]|nr:hypothetical protein [Rhodoluna sp.]
MSFLGFERGNLRGLLFQLGFTLFAAWLVWPIYGDSYLAIVLAVAVFLGITGARLLVSRSAGWLTRALFGVFGVALVGPLVSSPGIFTSGSAFVSNWIDSVTSIIFGWKQLITIDPPVGTYHGLMTPTFLVFFVANLLAGLAVFGNPKRQWLAILPFFSMVVFAFAFGQASIDDKTNIFGFVLDIPSSWVSAVIILMASVKYLTPRPGKRPKFDFGAIRNVKALGRQAVQFGGSWALVLAALVAVSLVLGLSSASNREVLRSAPPVEFTGDELSPLSLYRQNFTDTKKLNQEVLRYSTSDANLERIRLAVMTHFNGQVFSVENDQSQLLQFQLLPAALSSSDGAKTVATKFELTNRNSAWLPLVDRVSKVDFGGAKAQSFSDHFYFNRPTNSGAILGKDAPTGAVSYTVNSFVATDSVDKTTIKSSPNTVCADASGGQSTVPQSVCDWLNLQSADVSNADGFEKLVQTLRARGFLSHSLDLPKGDQTWTSLLPGYRWVTSRAGHSTGRIDQMFKDLISLQEASKPGTPNTKLVATAGDDEQFATAAALLAQAAGYDSRVVLGFKTARSTPNDAVATCQDNACFGKNLTAWVEISSGGSSWLPIDVTPQFRIQPKSPPKVTGLKQHEASPGQDNASVLPPAQVDPTNSKDCTKDCGDQFDWVGLILNILGYVLLVALVLGVIFGPPLAIILGKRRRRRNRLDPEKTTLAMRITGAWDEYVDNLIDLGERGLRRLPANETRPELLVKAAKANEALAQSQYAQAMVRFTDFAAFAPEEPNPDYEREVWNFVDTEFAKSTAELSRYRKLRVQLSLRSIIYRASAPEANTVNVRRYGSDGSTFSAFVTVAKLGVSEGLDWLKPRVKKFVDEKAPFLNKVSAKVAPSLQKLVSKRKAKTEGSEIDND